MCIALSFLLAFLIIQRDGVFFNPPQLYYIILLAIAILLIGILVTVAILHRLVITPILNGMRIVQALMAGDQQKRWHISAQNELGTLAGMFNELLDLKQQKTYALKKKYLELRRLHAQILEHTKIQKELIVHQDELKKMVLNQSRELQIAKEGVAKADRLKSLLLATASHELRTPIAAMISTAELLLKTHLDSEQHYHLDIIRETGRHVLRILGDILDLSKIEAGKLQLEKRNFDLNNLIQRTIRSLLIQAKAKSLFLQYHIAENTPTLLLGDAFRLQQILMNLIANAIKFTERGGITVEVAGIDLQQFTLPPEKSKPMYTDGQPILFSVQDTGIGIEEEKQKRLFDTFYQGNTITQYGGTGLGLSICRKLIDLMGGAIWVESEVGFGSKFCFLVCLPRGGPNKTATNAKMIASRMSPNTTRRVKLQPTSLDILLAEDNPTNLQITLKVLEKLGHNIHTVQNGKEVLEELNKNVYHLVLMDLEMPEMDGLETTQQIRVGKAGTQNQKIPILGITAHTLEEVYDKCMMAGMTDLVIRPIDFVALDNLIEKYTASKTSPWENPLEPQVIVPMTTPIGTNLESHDKLDDLLDMKEALRRLGGEPQLLQAMFQDFLRLFPERMSLLKQAIEDQNFEQIFSHAHTIKGTTSQIGAKASTKIAAAIEQAANMRDMKEIPPLLQQLEADISRVIEAIQKNENPNIVH